MAARDGVVGRVAPVTAASLFVSPVKTDSPVSAETENGEAGFSFERNQFRGFNREANPFFCRAASLSAVAGVETGAGFATADFGYVRLRDAGYAEDELRDWLRKLGALGASWTDAFVFFKHEEKGVGPKLAAQFTALAGSEGAGGLDTAPIPTPRSG